METIKELLKRSDDLSSVVKHVDHYIMAIPGPSGERKLLPDTSLRSAINMAKAQKITPSDVLKSISTTRQAIGLKFKAANEALDSAQLLANQLRAMSAYIKGDTTYLPMDLASDLATACVAVKSASAAGLTPDATLISQIDAAADHADAKIAHHRSVVSRRAAASDVGVSKSLAIYLREQSKSPLVEENYQKLFLRSARRFEMAEVKARARSKVAIKHYNAIQRGGRS